MTNKHLKDASNNLTDKIITVMDHAIGLKKDGIDPMIPFAFVYIGDGGTLKSFLGDTPEYADKMFEKTILEEDPDYAIYGYDGFLTVEGKKTDAVIFKAYDKTDDTIYLVGQRFIPKTDSTDCETVGNPAFLGTDENKFYSYNTQKTKELSVNETNLQPSKPWWKIW